MIIIVGSKAWHTGTEVPISLLLNKMDGHFKHNFI